MTNNDDLALSRKEFEAFYNETHSVQITPQYKRFGYYISPTMQKAWEIWQQARQSLLAERDADKKVIADSFVLFEILRDACSEWERKAISNFEECARMSQRIAELEALTAEQDKRLIAYAAIATKNASEARTVSVKLPENTQLAEAPEHIWLQTAGEWPDNGEFSELTWCSDRQHQDDTLYVRADLAAGINLEVEE